VRQVAREAATPVTRLVDLPGRGVTRVWECPGPRGAQTLMLIHGVACTAELNWGKVLAPLGLEFRVVAADLRGHGDGISPGSRFRLEDCADDVAALAVALGIRRFTAVGYSMGGMVAQLMYRRHAPLLSGLVLCCTAANVRGSPTEMLAALALPTAAAAIRWNPVLRRAGADALGMSRTTLVTAVSAIQAVCEFSSEGWIGQVDVPTAVVVTARDRIVPASRQLRLARAIPGASVHQVGAGHGMCVNAPQLFARTLAEACSGVQPGRALAAPCRRAGAG